ncbi:exodeoxyribonuclease VII large subunit [Paracoccus sp. MC1862]|uniref:exodeoxyribonuclease VII large subunit n=1 Tax=Paracoccus sp. MC1862 TaxID=2760307 RepID=UPI0015FFEA39|nr:exodeoxyribonuclease VII large subunit [Paracoccus sp. MC1862]MBB1498237.1 exodeoxyribonuclease VII large subunit [Paracoccus sp. MC1862]QQO45725.1 exodeoxyribonuclease VII large subunit [Paracoccus sp. MC1862]
MELFEDDAPAAAGNNAPALSVSEISGAVKRVIEGEFGRVRVRGEVGRVSRPGSGHLYFDLKDDNASIAAVCWKGQAGRLAHRPEEGMEIIVTGRLTTFANQSRYQLIVEQVEPAGLGALMAMLESRRKALAAEGLFDASAKRPIPYLPGVIAVVTSPSGAVIRDILHRLRDRFPSRVLIWPVAVQGTACAPQVADAITRLNAIQPGGPVPRPDLIIVARGGGSVEDLWGFNDEAVVRAVAAGTIPLISAVGHETDTTLIDHAADLRAPTPTAAAEMAVPVLADLAARLTETQARLLRCTRARLDRSTQRLGDLGRALGRPQALTDPARQRLDLTAPRLEPVLRAFTRDRRRSIEALHLPLFALRGFMADRRAAVERAGRGLDQAQARDQQRRRAALPVVRPGAVRMAQVSAARRLAGAAPRLDPVIRRATSLAAQRLQAAALRLDTAQARLQRRQTEGRARMDEAGRRLDALGPVLTAERREELETLDRLRQTLGHAETLRRGFAIVRGPEGLVTSASVAGKAAALEIEFHDGRVAVHPEGAAPTSRRAPKKKPPAQGSLF